MDVLERPQAQTGQTPVVWMISSSRGFLVVQIGRKGEPDSRSTNGQQKRAPGGPLLETRNRSRAGGRGDRSREGS